MPRDRANINTGIWTDTDYRTLSRDQQWLYELLLTHPELSYAGVADWRPGRISQFAIGTTKQEVERIGAELQAKRFIVMDENTEEVLIRSFTRHDGLLKQPKLTVSMVNAYGAIASNNIREVFIWELRRLFNESPELKAFENNKVIALLKLPARPVEAFTQANEQPDTQAVTQSFSPDVTPLFRVNAAQAQALPTSTATTTSTSPSGEGVQGERKKPERPLPANWQPNDAHRAYATEKTVNIDREAERFKLHAQANDRRLRNWDAGFRMWLSKATPIASTASAWTKEYHK
ncbi:hypothetical protein [Paenarthrobacter sp. NPDC090522]|uniref:hypothetical protein n=1 Tax=Paenarthrobacter sp. NPDC090522 TaxID=3364383 RepID=UPI0037F176B3